MADDRQVAWEAKHRRNRAWTHNSYLGHAMMMRRQSAAIMNSDTATPEAKSTARDINLAAQRLAVYLKTRVD